MSANRFNMPSNYFKYGACDGKQKEKFYNVCEKKIGVALLLVKVNGQWVTPGQAAKLADKTRENPPEGPPEGENKPDFPGQMKFF